MNILKKYIIRITNTFYIFIPILFHTLIAFKGYLRIQFKNYLLSSHYVSGLCKLKNFWSLFSKIDNLIRERYKDTYIVQLTY